MLTEIKDQTKRKAAIKMLETVVEKHAASIQLTRLTLTRMIDNQVNRLAELRHQKMLLKWNLEQAAKATNVPKPE